MPVPDDNGPVINYPPSNIHDIRKWQIGTFALCVARHGDEHETGLKEAFVRKNFLCLGEDSFLFLNPGDFFHTYYKHRFFCERREMGMSFGDIAETIVDVYKTEPRSLLVDSMKTVLQHDLPLEGLPQVLQEKCQEEQYNLQHPLPGNLKPYGEVLFRLLILAYGAEANTDTLFGSYGHLLDEMRLDETETTLHRLRL